MTTASGNRAKAKNGARAKTGGTTARGRKAPPSDGKSPRQRIEDEVADRIIALLDAGDLPPWEKDWRDSNFGLPLNAVSMKPYRGINRWMTMLTQQLMNYQDPRWLTFRQAQALGGHVRKGEQSTTVVFWKRVPARQAAREMEGQDGVVSIDQNGQDGAGVGQDGAVVGQDGAVVGKERTYPMLRAYHLFNVKQTEECRLRELPEDEQAQHDPIETAIRIIQGMPGAPPIEHYALANYAPHYVPRLDVVRVPEMGRYNSPESYYNTVFHELVHSTGHPDRLHRFELEAGETGLHAYGREELVAGMGSAMLATHAGIGAAVIERDASYIRHWRDTIQGDKAMVIRAATLAQRAADLILDEPPPDFRPEKAEGSNDPVANDPVANDPVANDPVANDPAADAAMVTG